MERSLLIPIAHCWTRRRLFSSKSTRNCPYGLRREFIGGRFGTNDAASGRPMRQRCEHLEFWRARWWRRYFRTFEHRFTSILMHLTRSAQSAERPWTMSVAAAVCWAAAYSSDNTVYTRNLTSSASRLTTATSPRFWYSCSVLSSCYTHIIAHSGLRYSQYI